MNKYFLPVYHSELKPWIKWWILKRLNGGESSLKAVTLSSGTLTKVDKSKALSIKEYYGNTVQDGTPTPESPIEIQTISGDNTFTINGNSYRVDFGGKNKFDFDNATFVSDNRANVVKNSDNLEITPTGTYSRGKTTLSNLEVGTQYTISCEVDNPSQNSIRLSVWDSTNSTVVQDGTNTTVSSGTISTTFTATETTQVLRIYANARNVEAPNLVTYSFFQLEKGSVATEYSPYTANPIELCKIGSYVDKLFKAENGNEIYDNLDSTIKTTLTYGNWYIEKNVGKVVLNGSENWQYNSGNNVFALANFVNYLTTGFVPLSNYYNGQVLNQYSELANNTIGFLKGTNNRLVLKNTDIATVSNLKTWLADNNTTVYYVLSNPTYEIIDNEYLIQQLNALYEFYVESSKVTISNNSEIPFEVLLEYYGR